MNLALFTISITKLSNVKYEVGRHLDFREEQLVNGCQTMPSMIKLGTTAQKLNILHGKCTEMEISELSSKLCIFLLGSDLSGP